jgi:Fe-Mn family superoxide dismutase
MSFELPSLPYPYEALEPHISRRTMELHHDKHHQKYISTLNELIEGTPYAEATLDEIMRRTASKRSQHDHAIFNNAGQSWNHTFFWHSLSPDGGGAPPASLADRIAQAFGGYDQFREKFAAVAGAHFGSGWAWLILDGDKLAVTSTGDAHNPLVKGKVPLLTCDLWEHAYYLDYQNRREDFIDAFLDHLIDWQHVAMRLERAPQLEELR